MSIAANIIERFGGTRKLAAELGIAPSTVQSWKDAGNIPSKHQLRLLRKAVELGIALSPADFFPDDALESTRRQRESARPNHQPSVNSRFLKTQGSG